MLGHERKNDVGSFLTLDIVDIVELDHSINFNLSVRGSPEHVTPVSLTRVVKPDRRVSGLGEITLSVAPRNGDVVNPALPGHASR